ncbi:hypothetical protein PPERSA_06185 [Pseudocohnilembus persalinus]|uniref:Uncharacterized protein n=1 Tax=Pseudocohnilembus persalinus TaxID=266149 RepID=A0A0V0R0D2_PSEPJ|nr:hypothetical protein PPERSA_06185 [Pseudocohnilembus persalinus]|eukprot:KRX08007.1 hypothetical protein PPERSA_06185 [Pseudocohnilembus persalinus]
MGNLIQLEQFQRQYLHPTDFLNLQIINGQQCQHLDQIKEYEKYFPTQNFSYILKKLSLIYNSSTDNRKNGLIQQNSIKKSDSNFISAVEKNKQNQNISKDNQYILNPTPIQKENDTVDINKKNVRASENNDKTQIQFDNLQKVLIKSQQQNISENQSQNCNGMQNNNKNQIEIQKVNLEELKIKGDDKKYNLLNKSDQNSSNLSQLNLSISQQKQKQKSLNDLDVSNSTFKSKRGQIMLKSKQLKYQQMQVDSQKTADNIQFGLKLNNQNQEAMIKQQTQKDYLYCQSDHLKNKTFNKNESTKIQEQEQLSFSSQKQRKKYKRSLNLQQVQNNDSQMKCSNYKLNVIQHPIQEKSVMEFSKKSSSLNSIFIENNKNVAN